MRDCTFICRKCKHAEPVKDEQGEYREWQWCCGKAMGMGVVMGRLVPEQHIQKCDKRL